MVNSIGRDTLTHSRIQTITKVTLLFYYYYYIIISGNNTFKDYEIVDFLGSGSYGVVLKCRHKQDNQYYAVKIIRLPTDKEDRNEKHMTHFTHLKP